MDLHWYQISCRRLAALPSLRLRWPVLCLHRPSYLCLTLYRSQKYRVGCKRELRITHYALCITRHVSRPRNRLIHNLANLPPRCTILRTERSVRVTRYYPMRVGRLYVTEERVGRRHVREMPR